MMQLSRELVLRILVFFCTIVNTHALNVPNPLMKRRDAQEVAGDGASALNDAANSLSSLGGLDVWSNISGGIRVSMRNVGITPTSLDANQLIEYLSPVIVFAAFMIVFAVSSLIASLLLCFCGKKLMRRKKTPYSGIRRLITFGLFCFSIFVIFVTIITGLKSNVSFTQGLKSLIEHVNQLFIDTKDFGVDLSPVVTKTFVVAKHGAYAFTEDLSDAIVETIELQPSTVNNVNELILAMSRLGYLMSSLFSTGDLIDDQIGALISSTATFIASMNTLKQQMAALNDDIANSDGTFRLTNTLTIVSFSESTAASSIAVGDITSISSILNRMKPPNVPNMIELRHQTSRAFSELTKSMTNKLMDPKEAIQIQTTRSFEKMEKRAINVTDGIATTFYDIVGSAQTSVNTTFTQIIDFDNVRSTILGVIFGFSLIFVISLTVFLIFRSPDLMKKTIAASGFKWFVFFIFGLIFMLLAVVSGEACNALFENRGAGLAVLVDQYLSGAVNVSAAMDAKDQCKYGESILTVVSNLKVFDNFHVEAFNLTSEMESVLDDNNIRKAIGNSDVDSTLPFDFLQDIKSSFSVELRDGTFDLIQSLVDSGIFDPTTYPLVSATAMSQLTAFRNNLITFSAGLTASAFTFVGATNPTRDVNAVATFQEMADVLVTSLNDLLLTPGASTLATLEAERESIGTSILDLRSSAYSTLDYGLESADTAQATIDSLRSASAYSKDAAIANLPLLKKNLANGGNQAVHILKNGTKCNDLANDFENIQASLCISLLSTLDGFWLSYFVMALTGLLSISTFVATANAVANRYHSAHRDDQVDFIRDNERRSPSSRTKSKSNSVKDLDAENLTQKKNNGRVYPEYENSYAHTQHNLSSPEKAAPITMRVSALSDTQEQQNPLLTDLSPSKPIISKKTLYETTQNVIETDTDTYSVDMKNTDEEMEKLASEITQDVIQSLEQFKAKILHMNSKSFDEFSGLNSSKKTSSALIGKEQVISQQAEEIKSENKIVSLLETKKQDVPQEDNPKVVHSKSLKSLFSLLSGNSKSQDSRVKIEEEETMQEQAKSNLPSSKSHKSLITSIHEIIHSMSLKSIPSENEEVEPLNNFVSSKSMKYIESKSNKSINDNLSTNKSEKFIASRPMEEE